MGARGNPERVRKLLEELADIRKGGSYEDRRQLLLHGLGGVEHGRTDSREDPLKPILRQLQSTEDEVALLMRRLWQDARYRAGTLPKDVDMVKSLLESVNTYYFPSLAFNRARQELNEYAWLHRQDASAILRWFADMYFAPREE